MNDLKKGGKVMGRLGNQRVFFFVLAKVE